MSTDMRRIWTEVELAESRMAAIAVFRNERMGEDRAVYDEFFSAFTRVIDELYEVTGDLLQLHERSLDVMTSPELMDVARFLAAPPISADDLVTLSDVTLAAGLMRKDPTRAEALMRVIEVGLDHKRFPWVSVGRPPTDEEKAAATLATAALHATRKVETFRRNESGKTQEAAVKSFLHDRGYHEISPRVVRSSADGPAVGEYCGEAMVVDHKADVLVRVPGSTMLAIECKVSNSGTNSHKRLVKECGKKADDWTTQLGKSNVIPVAALAGVYTLGNLKAAQAAGVQIVWSGELEAGLGPLVPDLT